MRAIICLSAGTLTNSGACLLPQMGEITTPFCRDCGVLNFTLSSLAAAVWAAGSSPHGPLPRPGGWTAGLIRLEAASGSRGQRVPLGPGAEG
jgi:hypothetical protein